MKRLGVLVALLMLAGCGTVSPLRANAGHSLSEIQDYDVVVVKPFSAAGVATDASPQDVRHGTKLFAKKIIEALETTGVFKTVTDYDNVSKAIRIEGKITRYNVGDEELRGVVGLGTGATNLDAEVYFVDSKTGARIGSMTIDRNSWLLGGPVATYQTPESFIEAAAKKVAKELKKAKLGQLDSVD